MEALYLDCGARRSQLMRDSLGRRRGHVERTEWQSALSRGGVFLAILAFLAFLPLIVMFLPEVPYLSTVLFLWPQQIVPINTWRNGVRVTPWIWLAMWVFVAVVFAWVARRVRIRIAAGAALVVVILATVLMQMAIRAAGWSFSFDGP